MFCVIQEEESKKETHGGYPKEVVVKTMKIIINGKEHKRYYYSYSDEKFERTIKRAYRISVHHSYREKGTVKKKQFVVCTVSYYDIAEGWFDLYEYGNAGIHRAAEGLKCSVDVIYDIIKKKLDPIQNAIQEEFRCSQEFKANQEHERIIMAYEDNKHRFNEQYDLVGDEYDEIYDVFGVLREPERLEQVKAEFSFRKKYEEKSRSYYKNFYSNYTSCSWGIEKQDNYSDSEKVLLKKFYRILSKKYHPDSNPDKDTSSEMQLLNRMKNEWGV